MLDKEEIARLDSKIWRAYTYTLIGATIFLGTIAWFILNELDRIYWTSRGATIDPFYPIILIPIGPILMGVGGQIIFTIAWEYNQQKSKTMLTLFIIAFYCILIYAAFPTYLFPWIAYQLIARLMILGIIILCTALGLIILGYKTSNRLSWK